jgi:hypothetical protein
VCGWWVGKGVWMVGGQRWEGKGVWMVGGQRWEGKGVWMVGGQMWEGRRVDGGRAGGRMVAEEGPGGSQGCQGAEQRREGKRMAGGQ